MTGRYCARKMYINVMKNETGVENGRDKKKSIMIRDLFLTMHCSVVVVLKL